MAFHGDFTPVLAKHSKHFSLLDSITLGVERMQRNFEPMVKQVEAWRSEQITDDFAKLTIYRAFIEGNLEVETFGILNSLFKIRTNNIRIPSLIRFEVAGSVPT